ncbi:MAG: heme-binding domain-containing protein [Ferruginibacter sp.]
MALLVVLIVIQFIQPSHNFSKRLSPTDFSKIFIVPVNVQVVLKNACLDCHSNNTAYPWYASLQPMAWMLANHIKKGKEVLNFGEFGLLGKHRQISKLKAIASQVKDNEMPIASYKWMHKKARLSAAEKMLVISWMNQIADSLSANQ